MRPELPNGERSRRTFTHWLLAAAGTGFVGSVLYPVLRFLSPPQVPEATENQVEAGLVNDPDFTAKGYKIVRFGSEPVIVFKAADREFRAFTATCTHLACIVEYQPDQRRIFCNCHNGRYDLNGRNVGGPPPRPLTPFKVDLVAKANGPETIVVSRA